MSLRPAEFAPVPTATMRVAKAAFPKGCPAMQMRDELGTIYDDQMFGRLSPCCSSPGLVGPGCGNAVRDRITWKHVLGLEFADPGFDFSILCEFHACLIAGGVERTLLDAMSGLPATHDKGGRNSDRDGLVTSGAFPDGSATAVRSAATPLPCRPVLRQLSYQRR